MTPKERRERLLELGAELRALEAKAGLTERMQQAYEQSRVGEGSDIHLTLLTRDAYFSVADPELRRALMDKRNEADSEHNAQRNDEIEELQRALESWTRAVDRLPWAGAAIVAILPVVVGTLVAGVPGALGGAVAGFFLGQGVIHKAKVYRADGVKKTQADLDQMNDRRRVRPPTFSSGEKRTGREDEDTGPAPRK